MRAVPLLVGDVWRVGIIVGIIDVVEVRVHPRFGCRLLLCATSASDARASSSTAPAPKNNVEASNRSASVCNLNAAS
jgi:hypothetical protein